MRFCLRTNVWTEVGDLAEAEALIGAVGAAAVGAMADAGIADPASGAWATTDLVPADDSAREALRAEDLGPGISSALWAKDLPAGGGDDPSDVDSERDLRATSLGDGLAHALIRQVREAARDDPELDADATLRAAASYLASRAGEIDWTTWASQRDVR